MALTSSPQQPRVAVIGCGAWGRNIVRNFAELGALALVADDHADRVAALVAAHGGQAASVKEAIAHPDVEAVAIATPPLSHAALAEQALRSGKHVFVEKPITMTSREGEIIVALAREAGRVLMVGHILRYHAAFQTLQRVIAEGLIGRIRHIASNRLGFGAIRRHEDVIWCLAPHDLSMILALAGAEPASVHASATPILRPDKADMAEIGLTFATGISARVQVSWLNPFKEHRLVVTGETGMLVFEDSHPDPTKKLRHFPHVVDWTSGAPRAVPAPAALPLPYPAAEPLQTECAHFLDCIAGGKTPLTDGEEALRVMRVMERARDVAYAGLPARVRPAKAAQ